LVERGRTAAEALAARARATVENCILIVKVFRLIG
jgi:hypothetical protein